MEKLYCNQEVFKSANDVEKMIEYFKKAESPDCHSIFILSCNTPMKIREILSLKWWQLTSPQTNEVRSCIPDHNIYLNSVCRAAIRTYCAAAKIDPSEDAYDNAVFSITYNQYLSKLKGVAKEAGIDYRVGANSARFWLMNTMRNYIKSELYIPTNGYRGMTKKQRNKYYEELANFFTS